MPKMSVTDIQSCAQCGAVLLPNLLFSEDQIQVFDKQRKRERQRTKDFDLTGDSKRR
jgi:hypothetical protein